MLKDALLVTFGTAAQGLSRLLFTIVIGRMWGKAALGELATVLAITVFASLCWAIASGMAASLIPGGKYFAGVPRERLAECTRQFLIGNAVATASAGLVAWLVVRSWSASCAAAFVTATFGAYLYTRGYQIGRQRSGSIAIWDALTGLIPFALLPILHLTQIPALAPYALGVGYLVFAGIMWPRGAVRTGSVDPQVRRFIVTNSISQVAMNGLLNVSMFAVALFDTSTNAGYFAAAFSMATPAAMLGQTLQQVLTPRFAAMRGIWREQSRLIISSELAILVAFLMVGVLSEPLITLGYGSGYAESVSIMRALLVVVGLFAMSLVPAGALIANGQQDLVARCAVVGFVVGIIAIGAMGPRLGLWASVWGYGAGTATAGAMLTYAWLTRKADAVAAGSRGGA